MRGVRVLLELDGERVVVLVLDRPVEIVLAAHGAPTGRAAFAHAPS